MMSANLRTTLVWVVKFILVAVMVVILVPSLSAAWNFNWSLVLTTHALLDNSRLLPVAEASTASLSAQNCRIKLYQGLIAQALHKFTQRDEFWVELLHCNPSYLNRMHLISPGNAIIAEYMTQEFPEMAEGWFWLAEARASDAPLEAIDFYQRGLELDPDDAWAWCNLGALLSEYDLQAAAEAAAQCCLRGDPGCVGCDRVGGYFRRLHDKQMAIRYMRHSRCSSVLDLADKWEQQMQQNNFP